MARIKSMTRTGLLALLLIAWIGWQAPGGASSQAVSDLSANPPPEYPRQLGAEPVVARISLKTPEDLPTLAAQLDIWEAHPDYLIAMLNPEEWDQLASAGYELTVDTAKTEQVNHAAPSLPGQTSGIPGYPCYRTVEETNTDLSRLASEYPGLARWIDIGDSWEKVTPGGPPGYDLNVLILTNQNIPGPKPVFFLMAAIHARELVTAETAARFAEYLINQYGIDPKITALLDYYEIHILPLSNPDGRKMAEAGYFWRKNTDNNNGCKDPNYWGTDLNRNHSYKWGSASSYACNETYQGPSAGSEPETQVIQNYMLSIFPDQRGPLDSDPAPADTSGAMITLHSYGRLVLWPWGWTSAAALNDSQFATLGRKMAYFNNYTATQSINLYPTFGTSDDWVYAELGVSAYTIEMGTNFFQDCSSFNNTIYPDNLQTLLYAVQSARRPYQDPSGPDSISVQITPPSVLSDEVATLSATADDTRYKSGSGEPSQAIAAARYKLDVPSWISPTVTLAMNPADGTFNASQEIVTASLNTSALAPGRHTVFVESQDANGNWGVPGAGYLCVADNPHAPSLQAVTSEGEATPGEKVVYHPQVVNLGSLADSYTFSLSGASWPTTLTGNPGSLNPCAAASLAIEVSIPEAAFGGTSSVVTLTATSQADPSRSFNLDLTTSAFLDYRVEFVPMQSTLISLPGETITHTIQISNSGNVTATYALALFDNLWPTDAPPETIQVNRGTSYQLKLPVHIPADAPLGSSDAARLRMQSLEFSKIQTTILLTTRAWWRYYFPFVVREP